MGGGSNPSFNDDARILGDTDETRIGNVGDRLKVTNIGGYGNLGATCPVASPKYRVKYSDVNVNVPASYATMYTYSGTGLLWGFKLDFNDDDTEVRLEIDGEEIFEILIDDLENIFSGEEIKRFCGIGAGESDRIEFCPPCPIAFTSNVLIQARRTDGSDNTMNRHLVAISKVT